MITSFLYMGYRLCSAKCLVLGLSLTFIMGCYLASVSIPSEQKMLPDAVKPKISHSTANKKTLAILVPFRDRFEELLEFVPHMYKFLDAQNVPFHIFVIQQKDNNRFNRASLINVGFLYTKNVYDYIAMHDVDLLPLNPDLKYDYPAYGPLHISSPKTHPKYHYSTFIGGILLVKKEHYELVNGMSNKYWGWGLEDDEFYVRLKEAGLKVTVPANVTTGPDDTFLHIHDKTYRRRDGRKCYNQREVTRKRDRETGLHNVAYRTHSVHNLTIDSLPVTVLSVELICDKNVTPWCQCPEPVKPKKTR
ncbi:beta-1,4-galactosyltransferase 7 [Plutella xylostella]|uniref:beta-1,4-galactosyltransferase 7 n=1 Tax=Plutella xylostella TaxID=51655 RepID=UPI0020327C2A|nr:beta-1,4-galactosyltransferase 7 [Plutella xylostella]